MLTEKNYCDYETCVALKELGYVGSRQECECFGAYFNFGKDIFTDSLDNTEVGTNEYLRVSLYLAQKWLREEKKLHITIYSQSQESWQYRITKPHQKLEDGLFGEDFSSFEDALINAIKECIKYVNQQRLLRL